MNTFEQQSISQQRGLFNSFQTCYDILKKINIKNLNENNIYRCLEPIIQLNNFYENHKEENLNFSRYLPASQLYYQIPQRLKKEDIASIRAFLLYFEAITLEDPVLRSIQSVLHMIFEMRKTPKVKIKLMIEYSLPDLISTLGLVLQLKPLVDADLPHPAIYLKSTCSLLSRFNGLFPGVGGHTIKFINDIDENFISLVEKKKHSTAKLPMGLTYTEIDNYLEYIKKPGIYILNPESNENKWPSLKYGDDLQIYRKVQLLQFESELIAEKKRNAIGCSNLTSVLFSSEREREIAKWMEDDNNANMSDPLKKAYATLEILENENLRWLTNVPIDDIAHLREDNETAKFREIIKSCTNLLGDDSENIRLAIEVSKEIANGIYQHQKQVRILEEKYSRKGRSVAGSAIFTLLASYLEPIKLLNGGNLAASFSEAQLERKDDLSNLSNRTLFGVLAKIRPKS